MVWKALCVFGLFIFGFGLAHAQYVDDSDLAIGVQGKDINGTDGVGAVYVYDTSGTLIRAITNPDDIVHGQFGQTITYVKDKLVVSAPWLYTKDNKPIGALYVFDGIKGTHLFTIQNPEPIGPDEFGWSLVSLDDKIIASAPSQIVNGVDHAGVVYVFDANTGNLLHTINNPDPRKIDIFGNYAYASDDKIIVGIPGKDAKDDETSGVVSVFDKSGSWISTINNPEPGDSSEFGNAIATLHGKLMIGAPKKDVGNKENAGAVYVFDMATGLLVNTINNPDPDDFEFFGKTIANVGDNFVVGAPDAGLYNAGRVFIFNGNTYSLINTIDSPQKSPNVEFGYSNEFGGAFAYHNGKLVVGDRGKTINGTMSAGGAYVYDTNNWNLLETIDNPNPIEHDSFGNYVAFIGKMDPSQESLKIIQTLSPEEPVKTADVETQNSAEKWVEPKKDTISAWPGILQYDKIPDEFDCELTPKIDYAYVEKTEPVQYPDHDSLFMRIGGEDTEQDFQIVFRLSDKNNIPAKDLSYHILLKNQDGKNMTGAIYSPDAYSVYSTLGVMLEANNKINEYGILPDDVRKNHTELFGHDYILSLGMPPHDNYDLYVRVFDSENDWVYSDTCGIQAIIPIMANGEDNVSVGQIQFSNILVSALETNYENIEMTQKRINEAVARKNNATSEPKENTVNVADTKPEYLSPLEQLRVGTPIDEIQCREGLVLAQNPRTDNPLCLKPETFTKLKERNWLK